MQDDGAGCWWRVLVEDAGAGCWWRVSYYLLLSFSLSLSDCFSLSLSHTHTHTYTHTHIHTHTVTLSGTSDFEGFLLQARDAANQNAGAVGSFTLTNPKLSQLLTCDHIQVGCLLGSNVLMF